MATVTTLLALIPGLPLAAAILTAVLGPRVLGKNSHLPTVVALPLAFVLSLVLCREVLQAEPASDGEVGREQVVTLWTWASVGDALPAGLEGAGGAGPADFRIEVVLRSDGLTAMMLAMVTFIATLVAVYSIGYMHGDRGYWRFFSYLGLFVFSMTMLVSVSNFLLLYVFWEAVGVCSYLLIGFWYEKPSAAAAGKKAFLVNRVGDFGLALALFLMWIHYGTLNFHDSLSDGTTDPAAIAAALAEGETADGPSVVPGILGQTRLAGQASFVTGGVATAICLLLLLGACGKSAQFPLHVWLPDAMEGPTSVSALIHAATMVTAGVYLVARSTPLFTVAPEAQLVVGCIGGGTALLAALIALTQNDLKRVLAYSTISQLGFMFLALGTGTLAGVSAGMFHLFTHAFFKALLFLGAGSVMHAMGNVIDMRRFGGLRRLMPATHATFAVGCLALAGVIPFAGFWSKDAVVAAVHDKVEDLHSVLHDRQAAESHSALNPTGRGSAVSVKSNFGSVQTRTAHGAVMTPVALAGEHTSHDGHDKNDHGHVVQPGDPIRQLSDDQLAGYASVYHLLYVLALITAFLTAFYTFRAFFLTFYGPKRVPEEAGDHAHESPAIMTIPLWILAIGAAVVGLLFDRSVLHGPHAFAEFIATSPSLAWGPIAATRGFGHFHYSIAAISTLVAMSGVGTAAFLYLGDRREVETLTRLMNFEWLVRLTDAQIVGDLRRRRPVALVHRAASAVGLGWLTSLLGYLLLLMLLILFSPLLACYFISPYLLSQNKFYFDELYDYTIVRPLRGAAGLCYWIDRWLVDGLVNLLGRLPVWGGALLRSLQMGLVQFYALAMVLGVIVLVFARALWAWG